jgi:hypothetical protein
LKVLSEFEFLNYNPPLLIIKSFPAHPTPAYRQAGTVGTGPGGQGRLGEIIKNILQMTASRNSVYFSSITGYPAFLHASTPPRSALAFLYPISTYLPASRAALASLAQAQ